MTPRLRPRHPNEAPGTGHETAPTQRLAPMLSWHWLCTLVVVRVVPPDDWPREEDHAELEARRKGVRDLRSDHVRAMCGVRSRHTDPVSRRMAAGGDPAWVHVADTTQLPARGGRNRALRRLGR